MSVPGKLKIQKKKKKSGRNPEKIWSFFLSFVIQKMPNYFDISRSAVGYLIIFFQYIYIPKNICMNIC